VDEHRLSHAARAGRATIEGQDARSAQAVVETPPPQRPIRQLSLALTIAGTAVGLILLAAGAYLLFEAGTRTTGALLLVAGLLLACQSLFVFVLMETAGQAEANIHRLYRNSLHLLDSVDRIEPLIKMISHNSQISDSAKSLAHRDLERDALRQAIREEMYSGEMEAVQYLIDEMERRFGYRQEAQKLREEIAQVREMTIEEKINEAIVHIERLMAEYQWERAARESERLMKLFPRHERVTNLPTTLNERREARKQELLTQWKQAVEREEVDHGIAILTELDEYLTKEEAQALQDSARHVFKARLLNLGVQFGLAVTEARWRDALEVGLRIRQEFPNSRMAHEVSGKVETLRLKAGFVADAEIIRRRDTQEKGEG